MATLRAQQKEDRRNRIVSSAKTLFSKKGFGSTTIDSIARAAGVSGVTVHNYYGTKGGVLLALVIDSDKILIERLDESLPRETGDLVGLTLLFARKIMDHAIANLDKPVWRQVIAAVITEAGSPLSRAYSGLDRQLAAVLVRRIEAAQAAGLISAGIDAEGLGGALFQLQNARFIQFISDDESTRDEIEEVLRQDIEALLSVCQS